MVGLPVVVAGYIIGPNASFRLLREPRPCLGDNGIYTFRPFIGIAIAFLAIGVTASVVIIGIASDERVIYKYVLIPTIWNYDVARTFVDHPQVSDLSFVDVFVVLKNSSLNAIERDA